MKRNEFEIPEAEKGQFESVTSDASCRPYTSLEAFIHGDCRIPRKGTMAFEWHAHRFIVYNYNGVDSKGQWKPSNYVM